jgi:TrpR-related protein YerC/YecD
MNKFRMDQFQTGTPSSYPSPTMDELFQAILSLKNEAEAKNFFRDLLTMPELKEFANRWQIVKLLYQKISYGEIAERLNVSTTTVTRVAYWLNNGFNGYKEVADRTFETKFRDSYTPKPLRPRGKRWV